ncbi:hypothetical protein [Bifidobacterium samirii]|uniref:Uncharacterized protein n=1 Tax=Bifidobacterium samirii TaxID=2306974 RepID=A0A430FU68_9BIFI|nr:hypothetical protein [Bifidobacterium samirii]RSX56543.1 hypothetical protein D2E24_1088 [Bifidobacterium samirii]
MSDRDLDFYEELASAFGWDDAYMTREDASATLADMFPNAESAAEIEEEVFGF